MSIGTIIKELGYRFGVSRTGGSFMSIMEVPPGWNQEQYLRSYGEVGWLFGAVSLIAGSVAEMKWRLYREQGGERVEVDKHPILDLFSHVNPWQTGYQIRELAQMYLGLVGESFVVLTFDEGTGKIPMEMYLAMPQYMQVKTSPGKYIDHYVYQQGAEGIRLEAREVIHILSPNPMNPWRGLGPAQSIGTDLDTEKNAAGYNNRLLYNSATPDIMIEFPDMPSKTERDELREEWNEKYQGWRNARKAGFLWGGAKANTVAMTNRDMDFWRLRNINRDIILAAFHMPKSIMGLEGAGSRARVEADEYIFAKRVVKPALTRMRESFNEQLIPLYGDKTLKLDFDDPIPENREQDLEIADRSIRAGFMTINEARSLMGLDAVTNGDVFIMPMTSLPAPAKSIGNMINGHTVKLLPAKALFIDEDQKEAFWKTYAEKTEGFEKVFISALQSMFRDQEEKAIASFENNPSPGVTLLHVNEALDAFEGAAIPVLTDLLIKTLEDAKLLIKPENPHADSKQFEDSPAFIAAMEWLKTRIGWAANEVGEETAKELANALAAGFENGESIPQITERVKGVFTHATDVRATLIARTETIMASNEGALQGYEASDVVEKVEFYAALDDRNLECMCRDLHGMVRPLTEAHGIIPVHPNCRCVWLPIVE